MYHDAKSCCCCCCPFCYVAAFVAAVVVRFALLFTQVVASSCFVFQSSIYCSCARFMEFAAGCNLKCVREYVKTNEMVSSWESVLQVVIIYEIIQNSQTYNRSMYLNISWNYPIYHLSTYVHMYTIPAKLSPYLFILSPVFLQYFAQLFMRYW